MDCNQRIKRIIKKWGINMKKETKEKLQNVLEKAVAVQEVAGGNLLVLKDGQEVCAMLRQVWRIRRRESL